MSWTYLLARESQLVASPAPSPSHFAVTAGGGPQFIAGPATIGGNTCIIKLVAGDTVTLASPLIYTPKSGDPLVQTILGQKDMVRLLVGDTDSTDQLLQDEEIDYFLTLHSTPLRAAILAAVAIAASYSRKVDYQVYQEIQEHMTDAAVAYRALAKELTQRAAKRSGGVYVGGLFISQKEQAVADTTLVKPFFTRTRFTEPGTENVDNAPPTTGWVISQ